MSPPAGTLAAIESPFHPAPPAAAPSGTIPLWIWIALLLAAVLSWALVLTSRR